jgi:O-antigen ligase
VICEPFGGVSSLEGSVGRREGQGAIVLGLLALVMAAAGLAQARAIRAERRGGPAVGRLPFARRLPAVAAVAIAVGLAGLVATGLGERGRGDEDLRGASRLTSFESQRYDYWRVGLDALADHPLRGIGAGGFRAEWLRERPVPEAALEVHSLPLEMAVELGVPGLLGLAALVGGVGVAGARALRRHPVLAPGACAGATVWFLHAAIDWDWQIPAVTLPALVLGGALIAASEMERSDSARAEGVQAPDLRGRLRGAALVVAPGRPEEHGPG